MAQNQLSVGSGDGSQPTTNQNLQPSVGTLGLNAANANSFQPNVGADQLKSSIGQTLYPTNLPSISLGATTSTTQTRTAQPVKPHHIQPAMIGIAGALFALAIVLFWVTRKSVNKTTDY